MSSDSGEESNPRGAQAWLDALSRHPIFRPKQESSRASHQHDVPSIERAGFAAIPKTPRRASESASEISDIDSQYDLGDASTVSAAARQGDPNGHGGRRSLLCVIRESELVVAVGRELRILNLAEVKAKVDQGMAIDAVNYKVLYTPLIDFDIQSIVTSKNNPKLLAVVGICQLAIVIVPRREWSNLIANKVECRMARIGAFHHGPASSPIISVAFHPLGRKGATLCVLTRDAMLREYDINADLNAPMQTLDFSQHTLSNPPVLTAGDTPGGRKKTFFGLDRTPPASRSKRSSATSPNASIVSNTDLLDEKEAVAFCFGSGDAIWSPLTVYCLMKSGAVFAVCPYLPKHASLPQTYIATLEQYVDLCAAQDNENTQASQDGMSDSKMTARRAAQSKFVSAISKHKTLSTENDSSRIADIDAEGAQAGLPKLRRQGPILLQPTPPELRGEAESIACDLCYLGAPKSPGVLMIAYSDGKVDECIDIEPIEARWEVQNEVDLPVMLVYESLDIGLIDQLQQIEGIQVAETLESNRVSLVPDPIHNDSVFVYHAFGVHSISLSTWLEPLTSSLAKNEGQSALEGILAASKPAAVKTELVTMTFASSDSLSTPVAGIAIISDVFLGYALLMLAETLQMVAREKGFNTTAATAPESSAKDAIQSTVNGTAGMDVDTDTPAYVSLLSRPPFEPAAPLDQPAHSLGGPRFTLPPNLNNKNDFEVTPASLRFLGQTVTTLRTNIRDLVQAGNGVQSRLETQCRELARQLDRIASLRRQISESGQAVDAGVVERMSQAEMAQKKLLERWDRILQRLMDAHEPVLSAYEQDWIKELDEMQSSVAGRQARSQISRLEHVRGQLDTLQARSAEWNGESQEQNRQRTELDRMGKSQLARFQVMLQIESTAVDEARQKTASLQARLSSLTDADADT